MTWFWSRFRITPVHCAFWQNRHWALPRRTIWDTLFLIITAGTLRYQAGALSGTAQAGDVLIIPPATEHEFVQIGSGPLHQFALHGHIDDAFGRAWAAIALDQWHTAAVTLADDDLRASHWHRLCALSATAPAAAMHGLGTELAALVTTLMASQPVLHLADEALDDDPVRLAARQALADVARPWTIGAMAALASLGEVQFRKRFKSVIGQSPLAWLNAQRLGLACQQLSNGSDSVASIAQAVGFDDADYFRRIFRKHCGCTPTAWRERRAV
jgi:AraC-like DNA-binding protein